jgi:hypothetical protein
MAPASEANRRPSGSAPVRTHGPAVARVSIETLRRLREALDRHAGQAEGELLRTLDDLIEAARWNGEAL